MYVARSYHYSAPKRPPGSVDHISEKDKPRRTTARQTRPPPVPLLRREALHTTSQETTPAPSISLSRPPRAISEPVAAPSKPVVIPRSTSGVSTQSMRTRGTHGDRDARLREDDPNRKALRPAVAALLAVTSIPPPNKRNPARHRSVALPSPRQVSIDELVQSWREENDSRSSSCANSVLELLLEQRDEDSDDISISDGDDEKGFLTSRSVSSESIPSTPGLDVDVDADVDVDVDERSVSSWNSPMTPTPSLRRASAAKVKDKLKGVASPPREDCILDHPLLDDPTTPTQEYEEYLSLPSRTRVPTLRSSLKSNLTASFQALKSAARSFSNFTAPSVPPDDMLTRSILSPLYPSEMRPKPSQGVPTPELRRYLNPTNARPPSPTELSMQLQEAVLHAHLNDAIREDPSELPMIQMQTYSKHSRPSNRSGPSRKKRGVDPSSEAGRALAAADPTIRQREPRENSDFLRVIVLEMNMRREGKLDAKAQGRARLWLPPRKARVEDDVVIAGRVPVRWIGECLDEED